MIILRVKNIFLAKQSTKRLISPEREGFIGSQIFTCLYWDYICSISNVINRHI